MNPLAWLNPARWLLYIAFAGALWLGYAHWRDVQQEVGYDRAVAKQKSQAEEADEKREVITQYVDRQVVKVVRQIEVVTETITKEVPVYVPSDTPALPAGWRLLHDAAARGEVPDAAGIADAAPVAADAAASTIVANYGACRATAERLRAWQQWATQQQTAR